MSQQVNLYQPVFRKQKRKFSAVAMLQAVALMVLVVGAMYGYTWWQVRQLRAEVAQADKQHAELTRKLSEVTRQFGEQLQSKELLQRIERTQAQVSEKRRLRDLLQGAQFNTQGFSDYLAAFARQHVPGVWLTGLEIVGAAEQLTLSGRSVNPELVPRYLQRLSAEQRLRGIQFQSFQMSRAGAAAYVDFLAKTGAGGDDAPEAPATKATP